MISKILELETVNKLDALRASEKFNLRIDEYSLNVFPVAFALYNAFFWMDYL